MRKWHVSAPGACNTAEMPCTGCLPTYGGRFVPQGFGAADRPDVGPSENVAAGIEARPVKLGSGSVARATLVSAATKIADRRAMTSRSACDIRMTFAGPAPESAVLDSVAPRPPGSLLPESCSDPAA